MHLKCLTLHIQDQKYALLPKEDGDVKQSASSSDKPEAENWDNDWQIINPIGGRPSTNQKASSFNAIQIGLNPFYPYLIIIEYLIELPAALLIIVMIKIILDYLYWIEIADAQ